MGFPDSYTYTQLFLPKLFTHTLSLLGFLKSAIFTLLNLLGLSHFLETPPQFHENHTETPIEPPPLSAVLIQELLPVIKFSDLKASCTDTGSEQPPESCAVCLYEFEDDEEIRSLINCKHIFHKCCVDHWMDHDHKTCPLCRKHFVPRHLLEDFNQRLWEAYYMNDECYVEDYVVPGF